MQEQKSVKSKTLIQPKINEVISQKPIKNVKIESKKINEFISEGPTKVNIKDVKTTSKEKLKPLKIDNSHNLDRIIIGLNTEKYIINLLLSFKSVDKVWKDIYNSKFDIFYNLKNENVTRGLQVKNLHLSINSSKYDVYIMSDTKNYPLGMLMVGINTNEQIGICYFFSEEYDRYNAQCSFSPKPKGVFSKLLQKWPNFLIKLESMLTQALIITPKIYKNSLSLTVLGQYETNERFKLLCDKYQFKYELLQSDDSSLYFLIDGLKIQVKHASITKSTKKKTYSSQIQIGNTYQKTPFSKGRYDMYIIELKETEGDFICLPEQLLIENGNITTESQSGNIFLHVYPHNHVKNRKEMSSNVHSAIRIQHHWTCEYNLWFSTKDGYMGNKSIKNFTNYIEYISTMSLITLPNKNKTKKLITKPKLNIL